MTAVSLAPAWTDDDLGYSEFYRRYHRPLTGYLQMGFRDADCEAVVQETFCRALAHWPEVRNMAAPWSWLAVTARNLARNNIRDGRGTMPAGLEVFHPATVSGDDVAEQVEASESLRRLAQAMAVLTPLQRRLVTVMVEEGLTGAPLARRLGMRPGAVRMHLCRMRLRLGEQFAALGGMLGVAPVAVLGVLRRLRASVHRSHLAGPAQVTLSAATAALGMAVLGLLPSVPGFVGGTGATAVPHAVSVNQAHWTAASTQARSRSHVQAVRPARKTTPSAPKRDFVASTSGVNLAGHIRAQGANVEHSGHHETAVQVIDRCLKHLTINQYYVACDEGSGTGTQ